MQRNINQEIAMSQIEFSLTVLRSLTWNPGTGVLIALLIAAAWADWRTMRIPNVLTAFGMVWGVAVNTVQGATPVEGLLFALGGLATGLALFLPFWLLRAMGAGDVKLMAMVGAFLGAMGAVGAAIVIGLVGGVCAIGFALSRRAMRKLAANARDLVNSLLIPGMPIWRPDASGTSIGKLPYGMSISAGTVLFLLLAHLGF